MGSPQPLRLCRAAVWLWLRALWAPGCQAGALWEPSQAESPGAFATATGMGGRARGKRKGRLEPSEWCSMADLHWQRALQATALSVELVQEGNYQFAVEIIAAGIAEATADVEKAFECSLGVAAMYRMMAIGLCQNPTHQSERRVAQICMRVLHLAMNWVTHFFVGTNHDKDLIDHSAWPISIEGINVDLSIMSNILGDMGVQGHARRYIPHTYRHPGLTFHIVSLCAYPPEHVLPAYAISNHQAYADKHGYTYSVRRTRVDEDRPPAWGKIRLMEEHLRRNESDWYLWFDCDSYFMNMTVTLDSVLLSYGGWQDPLTQEWELEEGFEMLIQEDNAMLNTGVFFMKPTQWGVQLLVDCYGGTDSVWIEHPWWENASFGWLFLQDLPQRYKGFESWKNYEDDMELIYPPQVKVAAQEVFNSYHPITSRFLHDTFEPGRFVLAFSGVVSASSPTVVEVLYGNYYRLACELNGLQDECVEIQETLPWVKNKTSHDR